MELYNTRQIREVLLKSGLKIQNETGNDFLILCPFHRNKNTPSMSVSKMSGVYICFNGSCGVSGNIGDLISKTLNISIGQALRIIGEPQDLSMSLVEEMFDKTEIDAWSQDKLDDLVEGFWTNEEAQAYMHKRGFIDKTLRYFQVGYSEKQKLVTVPLFMPDQTFVGVIGRGLVEKKFKNSNNLPTNKTLFNIDNARKQEEVFITESAFDTMMLQQSGYNAVATLGKPKLSEDNEKLLHRYFNKIVIATDNDEPGRKLGLDIADRFKTIAWWVKFPADTKDICDMKDNLDDLELDSHLQKSLINASIF